MQICGFSSSCLTVNEESLCFWLLVKQKENLEDVTLGSGRFFHCFLAFYRLNGWSINHEDQSYAKPPSTGGEYLGFPDFSCSTQKLHLYSLVFGWTSRSATNRFSSFLSRISNFFAGSSFLNVTIFDGKLRLSGFLTVVWTEERPEDVSLALGGFSCILWGENRSLITGGEYLVQQNLLHLNSSSHIKSQLQNRAVRTEQSQAVSNSVNWGNLFVFSDDLHEQESNWTLVLLVPLVPLVPVGLGWHVFCSGIIFLRKLCTKNPKTKQKTRRSGGSEISCRMLWTGSSRWGECKHRRPCTRGRDVKVTPRSAPGSDHVSEITLHNSLSPTLITQSPPAEAAHVSEQATRTAPCRCQRARYWITVGIPYVILFLCVLFFFFFLPAATRRAHENRSITNAQTATDAQHAGPAGPAAAAAAAAAL